MPTARSPWVFKTLSLLYTIPSSFTQSIPSLLPGKWSHIGCYTDISTSRTLRAKMFNDDHNMNIESCLQFCRAADYVYGGLEFGKECYCDSAIQVPSVQAAPTDCTSACSGNSTELCGGPNRLNVFIDNDKPVPDIVRSVRGSGWVYQGCFTDSPSSRTLPVGINIPTGVTAETCTATCQTAGYVLAGLENSSECFCANTIFSGAQHVSDNDCRAVCVSNHSQYCGNANRIAVYNDLVSNPGGPGGGEVCAQMSVANFTLEARFKIPPSSGPAKVPLKIVVVEMVPSVTWGVLSACSNCCSDFPTYSLQNSVFRPKSLSNPLQLMVSSAPGDGETPTFLASNPAFPGFQSYCVVNPTNPGEVGSNSILAFGGKSDAFSLCRNNTANNRLDVVYQPVTGHPHYILEDCAAITINVVT